jgi:tRNA threonylcarbamoyladenosine biosynthesis protein TsaE
VNEPDDQADELERGQPAAFEQEAMIATAAGMTRLGERLAGLLAAGDLVVLSGPLGAGKTTLAQGIGTGLRVRGPVTSPTFVIARVHPSLSGGPDLVHADAYRLGSRAEVDDLDLDADLATSVTVVEWGEGLVEGLADSFLSIRIDAQPGASPGGRPPGSPRGANREASGNGDDQARAVRVTGWGRRWLGAADAARRALAG